ncbi:MerR family transcriptional regulator [Bizionia gelidisalsuginis]|uniref:MerR family transcriptional regulator n=2 Tax=Bizionia TaxID=283785 RepID=A0A8H2LJ62_9FLAO|nr:MULTISPECIES: MerR family transcriptional regulator [Bizionia]TYB80091.1 MerR family transcriptional regulator [Bizionia saleffrena]TYC09744.1 MerR family transcriptional regulator [Bizionia gelidisalsuginis]
MNNIKTQFSIKDLENLSGIKAHTIRIWEKRYALFEPKRTETNIRYYDLKSLQKVLNISYLNRNGYKVSKIADLNTAEISNLVKEIALKKDRNRYSVDKFKMSMLNFDHHLFASTYNELIKEHNLDFIFLEVFTPLLSDIGFLWQTDSITPAHEHFIVELIKQKILLNTDKRINHSLAKESKTTYVLFLPENEVHELGLLFINYKLAEKGCHSVYLGQSVPIASLEHLLTHFNNITFISSFTVSPDKFKINDYLKNFYQSLLNNTNNKLIAFGFLTQYVEIDTLNDQISLHNSTKDVVNVLTPQV